MEGDPAIRGLKVFNFLKGSKGVFLTLGEKMSRNTIELVDVENRDGCTEIKIRTNLITRLKKILTY
jgi:hypothetical protein